MVHVAQSTQFKGAICEKTTTTKKQQKNNNKKPQQQQETKTKQTPLPHKNKQKNLG